jgi:hypothetical protein
MAQLCELVTASDVCVGVRTIHCCNRVPPSFLESLLHDKMANHLRTASERLNQVKDFLTGKQDANSIPFDPNASSFPTRAQIPKIEGAPEGAAWVWGKDDQVS